MKISYNWLRQYISTSLSPEEIGDILTQTGLEVEGIDRVEKIPGGLKGLVIGEVISAEKHPNADRLKVTRVNVGNGDPLQIVCGAPNVAEGQKVVVATVGAMLHPVEGDPFKIKKGKIRGEESHGMICAEDEIGLGESHDGIMVLEANAKVGSPAGEFFDLGDDFCLEIGLTPNRTDGMSHIGVARDLRSALLHMEGIANQDAELMWPNIEAFTPTKDQPLKVEVRNPEACPRYAGVCISDITVAPSPDWLQDRLRSIGLAPINNVVDITNFVMHETGQPLHAFDQAKIEGGTIVVDTLPAGTKFTTLDEKDRALDAEDLMICNGNIDVTGKVNEAGMCIGGVFGGIHSGVSSATSQIFLESAYFNPVSIRKSAKRHGLNTDASFRFERGVDPEKTLYALKRAALLIQETCGAKVSSVVYDVYPQAIKRNQVELNLSRMNALIGQDIPATKARDILTSLDFTIDAESEEAFTLTVPAYRTDVTREADVVEEVLRIYGYNAIELPNKLNISLSNRPDNAADKLQNQIADQLASRGFTEIMSNSLTQENYSGMVDDPTTQEKDAVKILNPLSSELGIMRQSLCFQGLETIHRNINHKFADLRFFEFGRVYHRVEEGYSEQQRLVLFVSGKSLPESWNNGSAAAGYPEILDAVESVFTRLGLSGALKMQSHQLDWLEQSQQFSLGKDVFGFFGKISADLQKKFNIDQDVFYAEINWDKVLSKRAMNRVKFKPLAKYPAVRRDLSLLVDEGVEFNTIATIANGIGKKLLKETNLFDVYEGDKLPEGKKSYAVSFVFQDEEATLKDKQIDAVMNKIIGQLQEKVSAELR
ncbi:MAG: phenylalanine--tRNA ligase subunit beta [Flavobacteriales bacterium]|nr:phenylalanine--tRNA ligase subunit beta [Flavobacteriales bacterium]